MAAFDRLHPALQHQVVNALGWRSLRPVQALAIDAALERANLLVLAPTAGGKTEAAFFPLISEALVGSWGGPAVLYVSPIKALLNNQQARLERYYGLVGLRAGVWHGDVPASQETHPGGPARLPADDARVAGGDARLGHDPPRPPVRQRARRRGRRGPRLCPPRPRLAPAGALAADRPAGGPRPPEDRPLGHRRQRGRPARLALGRL